MSSLTYPPYLLLPPYVSPSCLLPVLPVFNSLCCPYFFSNFLCPIHFIVSPIPSSPPASSCFPFSHPLFIFPHVPPVIFTLSLHSLPPLPLPIYSVPHPPFTSPLSSPHPLPFFVLFSPPLFHLVFTLSSPASPSPCSFSVQGSKTLQSKSLLNSYYSGTHLSTHRHTHKHIIFEDALDSVSMAVEVMELPATVTTGQIIPINDTVDTEKLCFCSKLPV